MPYWSETVEKPHSASEVLHKFSCKSVYLVGQGEGAPVNSKGLLGSDVHVNLHRLIRIHVLVFHEPSAKRRSMGSFKGHPRSTKVTDKS